MGAFDDLDKKYNVDPKKKTSAFADLDEKYAQKGFDLAKAGMGAYAGSIQPSVEAAAGIKKVYDLTADDKYSPVMDGIRRASMMNPTTAPIMKNLELAAKLIKADMPAKDKAEIIKNLATAPIMTVTAIPGAIVGGIVSGSGLGDKAAEFIQKIAKKLHVKPETLGALVEAGGMVAGIKAGAPSKAITKDISAVSKGLKIGYFTDPYAVGNKIVDEATKKINLVKRDIYAPARQAVEKIKAPKKLGKDISKDIKSFVREMRKEGKIASDETGIYRKMAKDYGKTNTSIKKSLNLRSTYDRKFSKEYKDATDAPTKNFAKLQKLQVRRIVTKRIYDAVAKKNPEALSDFKVASNEYMMLSDALDNFQALYKKSPELLFTQNALNKGTVALEKLKRLIGQDNLEAAGFNYLMEKSKINGTIDGDAFEMAVKQLDNGRGQKIFGEKWADIKDIAKLINKFEKAKDIYEIPKLGKKLYTKGLTNYILGLQEIKTGSKFNPVGPASAAGPGAGQALTEPSEETKRKIEALAKRGAINYPPTKR